MASTAALSGSVAVWREAKEVKGFAISAPGVVAAGLTDSDSVLDCRMHCQN